MDERTPQDLLTARAPDPLTPGQLLPTQAALLALREKLLSIFDVEAVLASGKLPWYHLQRDLTYLGDGRAPPRPIPGNDFQAEHCMTFDPAAWTAKLQFDFAHRRGAPFCQKLGPLLLPLTHIREHGRPEWETLVSIEEAADLIRGLWPDPTIGPSKYRQLGPALDDPSTPEYYMYHWLSSKELNGEVVWLENLSQGAAGHFLESRKHARVQTQLRLSPRDVEASRRPCQPTPTSLHSKTQASAHIWTFAGPEKSWIMTFPVIASILCLSKKPTATELQLGSNAGYSDRDLSWCLDSLHGFCRLKGPEDGKRDLSFSLGTSSDYWTHLHFILNTFNFDPDDVSSSSNWSGSGLRCDRRRVTVPISPSQYMTFRETRTWIGMRVATSYCGQTSNASPSTVGVIVSDAGHQQLNAKEKDWDTRGLQSPPQAAGVALFQTTLWSALDSWEISWHRSLDKIEELFKVKVDDQHQLSTLEFDTSLQKCKTYSVILELLRAFRHYINAVPNSIRSMKRTWATTYEGRYSEVLERFDEETQEALLENWDRVTAHLDENHGRLLNRIKEMEEEVKTLRDGLFRATSLELSTRNLDLSRGALSVATFSIALLPLCFLLVCGLQTEEGYKSLRFFYMLVALVTLGTCSASSYVLWRTCSNDARATLFSATFESSPREKTHLRMD